MRARTSLTAFLLMLLSATDVSAQTNKELLQTRETMVAKEIVGAGVKNERVIESLRTTPRHEFVPPKLKHLAYLDMALPIGDKQTISSPFIVAFMTEQIDPQPTDTVLEVGTGSGYQAAVLSPLVKTVYTIEIVDALGKKAERTLKRLKYDNVHVKVGDGYQGWPEHGPFDKIIVTCSPERVPAALVEQLRENGLLIVPVGERYQQTLYLFTKKDGKLQSQALAPTLFVPMTGTAEEHRQVLPDLLNPTILNGSFEESIGDGNELANWYYCRQIKVIADKQEARHSKRYLRFENKVAGREGRILQGFGIDGRQVSQLDISLMAKGKNLQYGQNRKQWAGLFVIFYDEARNAIGEASLGPWLSSFDWERKSVRMDVPLATREAILRIGLLGGTGELSIDDVTLKAGKPPKKAPHKVRHKPVQSSKGEQGSAF